MTFQELQREQEKLEALLSSHRLKSWNSSKYQQLESELSNGEWGKANRTTADLINPDTNPYGDDDSPYIPPYERIQSLSCASLCTINYLWAKYSNGYFGFEVQKQIWVEEYGGQLDPFNGTPTVFPEELLNKFGVRMGSRYINLVKQKQREPNCQTPPLAKDWRGHDIPPHLLKGDYPSYYNPQVLVFLFSRFHLCKPHAMWSHEAYLPKSLRSDLARGFQRRTEILNFFKNYGIYTFLSWWEDEEEVGNELQQSIIQQLTIYVQKNFEFFDWIQALVINPGKGVGYWFDQIAALRILALVWKNHPETLPLFRSHALSLKLHPVVQKAALEGLLEHWRNEDGIHSLVKYLANLDNSPHNQEVKKLAETALKKYYN